MARTRIISQSKAVYISPTVLLPANYGEAGNKALAPQQLNCVNSFSFDIDLAGSREDIREFGQLARVGTVRIGEITPTINLSYYLKNGGNEHNLGLNIRGINGAGTTSQFISGILTESPLKREKNIYVLTTEEGTDAFAPSSYTPSARQKHDVIGFGNAVLSNYSLDLSVGEIPMAEIEMECGNVRFYTGQSSGAGCVNPSLVRETAATLDTGKFVITGANTGAAASEILRPGDVKVTFSSNTVGVGGVSLSGINIQSASIEVPLGRETLERLGSQLPFAKPLEVPIDVTCSINGMVTEFTEGALQSILTGCAGQTETDITISVLDHCAPTQERMRYVFKNAVLDSQNFSIGIDDNETVDLTFSAQIAGATTNSAGVFFSGAFDGIGVSGVDNEVPKFY